MMNEQELDNLLTDYLSETTTDNDDLFVDRVMQSLPKASLSFWWRDLLVPTFICGFMLLVWKLKLFVPVVFMTLFESSLSYLQLHLKMPTSSSLLALTGLVFLSVCFYAYEEIFEN